MPESNAPSTAFQVVPSAVFTALRDGLNYMLAKTEKFMDSQREHLPLWMPVMLGIGIATWFALDNPAQWTGLILGLVAITLAIWAFHHWLENYSILRKALVVSALLLAGGCALIWLKSTIIGAAPIEKPVVSTFYAAIGERTDLPARDKVRLLLVPGKEAALPAKIRVNLPRKWDDARFREGAVLSVRARLMPPAGAALPGAYNFAQKAWFEGISATGTALEKPSIIKVSRQSNWLPEAQSRLSRHIQSRVEGSPGAIAATLATGDRGAIADEDAEAMRRAGLAHLLSISGLHVSAVVAAIYLLVVKLLALFPALALKYRLPLIASVAAALGGLAYTLLTGAQVPTIRACIAAILVLTALAMGRDPLSMRLVAAGAAFVLIFWPEALAGPSFQLSFAAVITIIALHQLPWVQRIFQRRDEPVLYRIMRFTGMLFLTGLAIEIALMPIALYHFHKAGIYGALANIFAIPLTTFIIMPLEALALLLDIVGLGAPIWLLCGEALSLLLSLAHFVEAQPGSVTRLPSMDVRLFAMFVMGGLWFALVKGRARLLALMPLGFAAISLTQMRSPDILVHSSGKHLAITGKQGEIILLRDRAGDYTIDTLTENAGVKETDIRAMKDWRNAQCSPDFCTIKLQGVDRIWTVLASRSSYIVPERSLAAACKRVDIVVSDRWLPRSCHPRWLKADRVMLSQTGGLSIWLDSPPKLRTVAAQEGEHGWFRP
ncbi:ComEC/Rec2 family competence protein [Sphingorhabdus sp. Alg239-R122]|uniref:ComEC/Rec2 family competence protein n=1 Tax=Sphingorhabdus sp. Alg239-R122 TaxID=2305989 RepID=UPI0013DB7FE5|nr:ComEC/Rec2 family competence protein [Sphingorhabdus sp. Alg239-R122]